jgi:hypothetical protein
MSNRAQLLNTPILTSDPYVLAKNVKTPGNDFLEAACGVYKIPVPWMLCFRPEDMKPVAIKIDDDDDGNPCPDIVVKMPCTTVKQAIENLKASRPVFESIAGDRAIGGMFCDNAIQYLSTFPLPYLAVNPMEVMFMIDPLEFTVSMETALRGGEAGEAALMELSNFTSDVVPYAPDVLYATAGEHGDEARMQNCVALDIGYGNLWMYDYDRERPEYPELPLYLMTPPKPNLRTILDEITALARTRVKSAHVYLSFVPRNGSKQDRLKMLVSTDTEQQRETLLTHKPFRGLISTVFRGQMESVCAAHGFGWLGYVFRSDEAMKKAGGGEYVDWIPLPVEKGL